MKSIDKKSPNRQSDDTLIYILLLLLVALLVGGGIWWWHEHQKSKLQGHTYDYEYELGEFTTSPSASEMSKLIQGNRSRQKTVQRILDGTMKGRNMTVSERKKFRDELGKINFKKLDEILQNYELEELAETQPEVLNILYPQLYEQGKVLTRLKAQTSDDREYEEVATQKKIQEEWGISSDEEKEINTKMNDWITGWYNQARDNLLEPEEILTEYIKPVSINGRPASIKNSEDVEYFKKIENKTTKHASKDNWEHLVSKLNRPLKIDFKGYGGFITEADSKKSEEGKETFGLTITNDDLERAGWKDGTEVIYLKDNRRLITIKLKKELFFNRLGYEEWIIDCKKEKNSRTFFDICFEEVFETIVHELAHAIVNTIKVKYDGQEGGGHGREFYEFMKKIEPLIRETPEFSAFKTWWEAPREDGED